MAVLVRFVFKRLLNHFGAKAGDDEYVLNPVANKTFNNMLKNRRAVDLEHRFGKLVGQFAHARALARG